MKNDKTKLPRRSNEWAARGFIITFFLCLTMSCFGLFGTYKLVTRPEPIMVTVAKPKVTYHKNWLETVKKKDYLEIVLNEQTHFKTKLTNGEEDNYLELVSFSDNELRRRIDSLPLKNKSLIDREQKRERLQRLKAVENHVETMELKYLENGTIIALKLNDKIIRKEANSFWVIVPILIIGTILTAMHIRFFIKDPYRVYQNMKNPFARNEY